MTDEIIKVDCQGEGPEFVERAEWRQRGGKNGDRNYQYFREMFPALDDQIIDQFKLGFGATILYEDMSREELGNLIYNAIAIGYVSGQQQSAAEIARLQAELNEAMETLRRIADQRLFEEMTEEEQDDACFSDGYDEFIRRARAFLTKGETDA